MERTKVLQWCFAGVVVLTPFALFHQAVFAPPSTALVPLGIVEPPKPEPRVRMEPLDPFPRVRVQFSEMQQFGIVLPRLPDSDGRPKRLTHDERGSTNNTVVRIDGHDYLFGSDTPGTRWLAKGVPVQSVHDGEGWQSIWEIQPMRICIVQTVELTMGG